MFFRELWMGFQKASEEAQKSLDVEKEDEMNKEDGSEEEASEGTDESMDM
jgi:hypothetical protein